MEDAEKLIAWVREAADELEKAHAYLDQIGVPRVRENPMTLAARIATLNDSWQRVSSTCPDPSATVPPG